MLISTAWIGTLRRGRYAAQLCKHVDHVARNESREAVAITR